MCEENVVENVRELQDYKKIFINTEITRGSMILYYSKLPDTVIDMLY